MKTIFLIIYLFSPIILMVALILSGERILAAWKRLQKHGKRSPLRNYKLWRNPGEKLKEDILDEHLKVKLYLVAIPLTIFVYTPWYFGHLLAATKGTFHIFNFFFVLGMNALLILVCLYQMLKSWKQAHKYMLGYDGEVYVGQHLNHLMAAGCRVFHDFQEDTKKFNIDHIVVSPAGVFAIETKGVSKPDKKRGTKDAEVIYDGNKLVFPDNKENQAMLDQAKKNARWLSSWLSSATGIKQLQVKPVLALPGWYITYKAKNPEVRVYNGKLVDDNGQVNLDHLKRSFFFYSYNAKQTLSDENFSSIVHHLDVKCRNVDPEAYSLP